MWSWGGQHGAKGKGSEWGIRLDSSWEKALLFLAGFFFFLTSLLEYNCFLAGFYVPSRVRGRQASHVKAWERWFGYKDMTSLLRFGEDHAG